MGLTYRNLDATTRQHMVDEIARDVAAGTLYLSDNLNAQGRVDYPGLLQHAAGTGTDDSLAAAIRGRLNSHEKPRTNSRTGTTTTPVMRSNAHDMLAEGEFNRFYIRALCLRAGSGTVTVYRAKYVENARSASEAKIGQSVDATTLLADLRANTGVDTALGLPAGPNSGLSVHL